MEKIPGAPPLPTLSVFKGLTDKERARYGDKYTNYYMAMKKKHDDYII